MDEACNRLHQNQDHSTRGGLLGHAHRWAGGALLLAILVGCELGPDRIGVGVSRTFGEGSHLVSSSGEESRSDLRNSGNDDSYTLWVYGEVDINPQKVEFVRPPQWTEPLWPPIYTPPEPVVPIILDHGAHQDPTDEADLLKKGLDAVADTSWSTIEKIGYLVMSLAVLGLVFFGIKVTMKKKE